MLEGWMPREFTGESINLESVCALVTKLEVENDSLYCEIQSLQINKEYLQLLKLDDYEIRPRGIGSFEEDGCTIKDYTLIALAITKDPS